MKLSVDILANLGYFLWCYEDALKLPEPNWCEVCKRGYHIDRWTDLLFSKFCSRQIEGSCGREIHRLLSIGLFSSEIVLTYLHAPNKSYPKLNYHTPNTGKTNFGTWKLKHSLEHSQVTEDSKVLIKKTKWYK